MGTWPLQPDVNGSLEKLSMTSSPRLSTAGWLVKREAFATAKLAIHLDLPKQQFGFPLAGITSEKRLFEVPVNMNLTGEELTDVFRV